MDQDVLNLIKFFSNNKNLTAAQRSRFNKLIARDCEKASAEGKVVKMGNDLEIIDSENETKFTDKTFRHHNPHGVIEFLRLFSSDDILKWFTHKWDNGSKYLTLENLFSLLNDYKSSLRTYSFGENNKGVPAPLYYHVLNFITPDKTKKLQIFDQFGETIEMTWGCKTTQDWCSEHPGIWPSAYITPEGKSFEYSINRFKRTIEFRTDCDIDDKFSFQIRRIIESSLVNNVKIKYSSNFRNIGRDVNIYCDIKSLFAGIKDICDWIRSYKSKGDTLLVDMEYHNSFYLLKFLHQGSYFSCPKEKLKGLSGNFKDIREKLFSVCDFFMIGRRNNGLLKVVALDESDGKSGNQIITETRITELENFDKVNGVEYIFKLYVQ